MTQYIRADHLDKIVRGTPTRGRSKLYAGRHNDARSAQSMAPRPEPSTAKARKRPAGSRGPLGELIEQAEAIERRRRRWMKTHRVPTPREES